MLQHDQLGINPAGGIRNPFRITNQYMDGLNLYEYVKSSPIIHLDPLGSKKKKEKLPPSGPGGQCGKVKTYTKAKIAEIISQTGNTCPHGAVTSLIAAFFEKKSEYESTRGCKKPCKCKDKKTSKWDFSHTFVSTKQVYKELFGIVVVDCLITAEVRFSTGFWARQGICK